MSYMSIFWHSFLRAELDVMILMALVHLNAKRIHSIMVVLLHYVNVCRTSIRGFGAACNLLASEERQSIFVMDAETPLFRRIRLITALRIVVISKILARRHMLSLVDNVHVLVIIITIDEPSRIIKNSISWLNDDGVFYWNRFILNPTGRAK